MQPRKLTRSQLRPIALKMLQEQGAVCPLCRRPIDLTIKGEMVVDHCHSTGQVRGALHRSCNAALGKMDNAVGRWGAKSMSYEAILPWLKAAVEYYEQPLKPYIYPTHKTADELRLVKNAKQRKVRATRQARSLVKSAESKRKST